MGAIIFDEVVDGDAGNLVLARSDALPPIGIFDNPPSYFSHLR